MRELKKVVLAVLRKERGMSLSALAAACRQHKGGEGMGTTQISAYLNGGRPIGDVHFRILCKVLRVHPQDVYMSRYLAGGRQEPVPVANS